VDAEARATIEKSSFGRFFTHGTGHGIGLQVHEAPALRPNSDAILQPGMVVTVEPGIYIRGWGGVRIEDDVLVTRTGHEVLSTLPKDLDSVLVNTH
jgi:Xaa-Pro aminopeptidase